MDREILFLAHRIPFPPNRGDKIRSHHLLRYLAQLAPVHVATFGETEADMEAETELAGFCATHILEQRSTSSAMAGLSALVSGQPVSLKAFYSRRIQQYVTRTLEQRPIGCIFVFSGQMAQYLPACDRLGNISIITDFVDVDSAKFESYAQSASPAMRMVYHREALRLSAFESQMAARSDISLLVSEDEAELFRSRIDRPDVRVESLANGIDCNFYNPASLAADKGVYDRQAGPHLVFTGQMDYPPNIEAVTHFAEKILPALVSHHPDIRFHIVGRAASEQIRSLAGEHVHIAGEVADIRPWIAGADAVVAPLLTARGVQNKVLEAMAMARPVVASRPAATGLDLDDGKHLLIADNDAQMIEKLRQLLDSPDVAAKMGQTARAHMLAHYGWSARLAPLAQWINQKSEKSCPQKPIYTGEAA